jgi:outer membrane protein insertion porin family
MTKSLRSAAIAFIFILASYASSPDCYSQAQEREGAQVTAVSVKNNRAISTETILSKVKTKVGDKFSQEVLNEDLKRLYATEYFTNVSIDVEDKDGGVAVTFLIEEKSVIDDIVFVGNKAFRSHKLKSMMKSKPNDMLNLSLLAQDIAEIKSFYIKKGYPLVDVKYEIDINKEENKAKITITIEEKTKVKVARIDITGNKAIKTGAIRGVLGTKPECLWLFRLGIFNEEIFQEDLEKVKMLYDDQGYLDAEVTPKMEYTKDGTALNITLEISEGKQYKVGDLTIKGNIVLPEKEIKSKIEMKSGNPFSNKMLRQDALAVRQNYYHYGYMNALVDVERTLNPATGNIDIAYNIDAKEIVYVGKIDIRGNTKTKDVVVRRELRVYPGQKFDGDKIGRSKERLYNLGLFEDISFDTEPTSDPNVQNLTVNVKETKTGQFSFGGGYSSVDFLVGFVEVEQRNFDIMNFPSFQGAGQDLVIRGEIGMVRQNYNLSWTDPWFAGMPFSLGFDLYNTTHKQRTDIGWPYNESRIGGDVRLGKELTDYLRAGVTYRLEQVDINSVVDNASQDLKNEEGRSNISSILGELTYDRRDNVFNPTRGFIINGTMASAGGFLLGDKNYIKGTGMAAIYHTFFKKFVLEVKGRGGLASPFGKTDEVPIYERFFAGGANTIRGYRERSVSPRDPGSNEPIGGEAVLMANAELTFPIYEKVLKGAIFYDVGNVWRHTSDFSVGGNYRQGVGVGVRVKTPLGPFKLDYGYPLSDNYGDKKEGQFYFSISRGF